MSHSVQIQQGLTPGGRLYVISSDPDEPDILCINEEYITDVGIRRIYVSQYTPPSDDTSVFYGREELGVTVFLSRSDAERALLRLSHRKASSDSGVSFIDGEYERANE